MSVMTAQRTELPDDRPVTVEDLEQLPDDGNRYELDDGVLVVSPSPAVAHQLVVTRMITALDRVCPGEFLVLDGPGIAMSPIQYRIPDVVVVRADAIDIADRSVTKPPVLAIEVASPSTAIYDRNRKKDVYAGFGISLYWIVTPSLNEPAMVAFELSGGTYTEIARVTGEDSFHAKAPFPVTIVPAQLIAGPWQRSAAPG